MARKVKTHAFRGRRYRIYHEDIIDGYTEVPKKSPPELYISPGLPGRRRLEVTIHEAMHAEDPDIGEAVIERRARSLAHFLWRLGYRQQRHNAEEA